MKITFLGTSCMVPTKERSHQSILIVHNGEGLLFDCGEGTQRQLKLAGVKPCSITKIFISHWHGDHVFGLPGLLQTMNGSEYEKELEIYGPIGTKEVLKNIFNTFSITLNFPYKVIELKDEETDLKDLVIMTRALDHSVTCIGFSIKEKDRRRLKLNIIKKLNIPDGPILGELQSGKNIEWKGTKVKAKETTYVVKGKKVAIVLDTTPCKAAMDLAQDSDLLICEAVYTADLIAKADQYKHLTARQAAQLASQSNVKQLIITHFSQRYKTTERILDEAKIVFENVLAAHDLMRIKL